MFPEKYDCLPFNLSLALPTQSIHRDTLVVFAFLVILCVSLQYLKINDFSPPIFYPPRALSVFILYHFRLVPICAMFVLCLFALLCQSSLMLLRTSPDYYDLHFALSLLCVKRGAAYIQLFLFNNALDLLFGRQMPFGMISWPESGPSRLYFDGIFSPFLSLPLPLSLSLSFFRIGLAMLASLQL